MGARTTLEHLELDPDFTSWALAQPRLRDAYEHCTRGDWILQLATRVGVTRSLVVAAACSCAEIAHRRSLPGHELTARAIARAVGWTRGETPSADCWASAFTVSNLARELARTDELKFEAAMSVASAAFACDSEASDRYYGIRAYAADAAFHAARAFGAELEAAHQRCADLVRQHIDYAQIERLLGPAVRASMLPPSEPPSSTELAVRTGFDEVHADRESVEQVRRSTRCDAG